MAGPGQSTWVPAYFTINAYWSEAEPRLRLGGGGGDAAASPLVIFLPLVLLTAWQRRAARGAAHERDRRSSLRPRRRGAADYPRASAKGIKRLDRSRSSSFLVICALFFCVPLYVIVVTSFKTMDQIRQGEIFSLPREPGRSSPGTRPGTRSARASTATASRSASSTRSQILFPSLIALDRALARSPATRWRCGT